MRCRRAATLSIAAISVLLLPATATADFQSLYDDYRTDGVIDGCAYSTGELSAGLGEVPADVREYDPGFSDALNAALEQAAAGCGAAPQAASTKNEVSAPDGSPGPALPHATAFPAGDGGRALPAVLTALIALLGTTLATAALLLAAHLYGWDLRGRLAPVSGAVQGAERRLAEGLRSLRDRLGF